MEIDEDSWEITVHFSLTHFLFHNTQSFFFGFFLGKIRKLRKTSNSQKRKNILLHRKIEKERCEVAMHTH